MQERAYSPKKTRQSPSSKRKVVPPVRTKSLKGSKYKKDTSSWPAVVEWKGARP